MSLAARHLESSGFPTVVIGSARDIVEECGVPRFLFVDFPLGNPCGKPWNVDMQFNIVSGGLSLLEDDHHWRERYMRVDDSNREALALAGEQRRQEQAARKR